MLRIYPLAARLTLAAALAVGAVALATAQSAPDEDKRDSQQELITPGEPPHPDEANDRKEAEAAEKAAEVPPAPSASTPVGVEIPPPPPAADAEKAAEVPPPPPAAETEKAAEVPPPPPASEAEKAAEVPSPPAAVETVEAPLDPLIQEIRLRLDAAKLAELTAAERAALTAFYANRKAPVWVTAGDLTARARHAMEEIARADEWGLEAKAFVLPSASGVASTEALADTEIKLSVAVLKYARYARGGRLEPSRISRHIDQKLSLRDPKVVLETVAGLETPGSYLRSLHPKHRQFELLRQALLKTMRGAGGDGAESETSVQLPSGGPVLKLGVEHPDVALLRKRLKISATPDVESLFDEEVLAAVKAYQRKSGLRDDGMVGPGTRRALNGRSEKANLFGTEAERLIVNMERWRWMPEDLGEFHVWDNIPEFMTRIYKQGRLVHKAKIIVGRAETPTVVFSANMRYIVFGPEWGVPDSIKVKEILPKLRPSFGGGLFGTWGITDTTILDQQNIRVVYKGRVVDAGSIDWSTVDIRKYSFIQAAGPGNALGAVKFRFPNKHDIYMHDTPLRHLFNHTVRSFSHGCVRVQDPGRFAEILLSEDKGWPASRVQDMMARGGNVEVTLSKPIPVHIGYFTAVAAEDGTVSYFSDLYGHDRRVFYALAGRPLPLEPAQNLDVAAGGEAPATKKRYQKQAQEDLFQSLFGN